MKMRLSNFSALSRVLSERKILPAVLKIRSTGADEAGMDNTLLADRATKGKSSSCDFHQASGSLS